jgi:nitrogen fixation protein NifZ
MLPRFDYGDDVRVIRNVRNDGTFPGKEVGELLIRRGSIGNVHDVGTYLEAGRMVGCREEELVPASDPWVDSVFEFRDRVATQISISVGGEVVVPCGEVGTVMKILRDMPGGPQYHVHFNNGRMFQIPERALELEQKNEAVDADAVLMESGDDGE